MTDSPSTTIALGPRISVREVTELHRSFRDHLDAKTALVIDGSAVEECDGAGAQFLTAFFEACSALGIPWSWSARSERLDDVARVLDLTQYWEPKTAA